jgi:hypothetical protein
MSHDDVGDELARIATTTSTRLALGVDACTSHRGKLASSQGER